MSTIGERITLCQQMKGYTNDKLSKETGISTAMIYRYKAGIVEKIPVSKVESLAKALDTTAFYLLYGAKDEEKIVENITKDEIRIIRKYRKLSLPEQRLILRALDIRGGENGES